MSDVNGKEITMPQLAESLVQATIGKWLKQPGESFEAYEPICEVITDKVVAELPATEAGVMEQIIAQEGETVDVGAVICRVRTDAAGVPAGAEQADQPAAAQGNAPAQGSAGQDMSGRYSPAVQR
ncbi:biotin/lipoyl-containing protein, partial [Paenibacillus thiaminolyticus]